MPQDPAQQKGIKLESDHLADLSPTGKSWFLGIGINQYHDFPSLNNAVKDVLDLSQLLQEEYDLLPEHTLTILDEAATRRNIIVTLDQLQHKIGPQDKLLIYYSGHGHLNKETGKGYWIPTDAEVSNTADYIRNSTIREYIETFRSLHTLLISDSCFSGTLFVRGASRSLEALHELAGIPSRWAICSGRHDEAVYDGVPGENSPFAESIMDTLRWNRNSALNVAKLVDRVIEQTRSNYEQLPEGNPLYGVGHKGGQYLFLKKGSLEDEWAGTQKAGTVAAYLQYLQNNPDGEHADEAREFILSIGTQIRSQTAAAPKKTPAKRPSKPKAKPAPKSKLLAESTLKRLRKAFQDLQQRTNSDAFVIIQEEKSGKFVQFAGGKGQEIFFDLPTINWEEDQKALAVQVLKPFGIELEEMQLGSRKKPRTDPDMIHFNHIVGQDIDLALELISRVMLDVYQFDAKVKLDLIEN
ncbi:caspase family protein [Flavilitoribacter nigricans]|nr:caspase family protein [Flavilitoribacter nigricans]